MKESTRLIKTTLGEDRDPRCAFRRSASLAGCILVVVVFDHIKMKERKRTHYKVAGPLVYNSLSALLRKRKKSCVEKEVVVMYILFVYGFPS